ncbi:ZZ-type zinc finger-containing protein 3 isoform X3 [Hydra vulgaris]|uniref:ZZ-type zinc finger-containing protein 3 isoform X3 n=1 Tax=Hydra vulgaris TaxID=6087 RepID=A0ABM4BQD9_HYDVU
MTNSDSDVDVCSLDDDSVHNLHTGLTVVAADTYVCTENEEMKIDDVVPLTKDDLLANKQKSSFKKSSSILTGVKYTNECEINIQNENAKRGSSKEYESDVIKTKQKRKRCDENLETFTKLKDFSLSLENTVKNKKDSDEELFDAGVNNKLNRFSFESDHLVLKNNTDYQALLKSLAVLEAQRSQAIKDLEKLHHIKEVALADPLKFVQDLQNGDTPKFPQRQFIASLPEINWMHYLAVYAGGKYVPQIATRNIVKSNLEGKDNLEEDSPGEISEDIENEKQIVSDEKKPLSFNKKWTPEEQEKLEKLLVLYPPEDVEQRRWEKIAKALGNRTRAQVTSRIQKYFLKLAKAKLPIPGRPPSSVLVQQSRKSKVNPISYKNSSFFPSWQPKVKMEDEDSDSGKVFPNYNLSEIPVSEDEDVPDSLKDSVEYTELIELKKIKTMQLFSKNQSNEITHPGYMCDGCKMDPIVGVRWHCKDCPSNSVDFCNSCSMNPVYSEEHTKEHVLIPLKDSNNTHLNDGNYVAFEQCNKFKYNYLDPNFVPS